MTLLVTFVLFFASTAEATIYYVSKQGSDSNACAQAQSASTPKLKISSGASCLKPGDRLLVKVGLYAEQLSNAIPSGTANSPTTVAAFPGEVVTIQPATGVTGVLNFSGPDKAYIVIDRMIVDCVNASKECVSIRDGAHHIKIENTEIKNSPGVGVLGGIASEFSSLNVHHHKGQGFYVDQAKKNVIYRSVIHNNGSNGIEVNHNAKTTQIYNNTINKNSGYGIDVQANASGTVISNNILSSNVNGAITNAGIGTVMANNLSN
jgi:hypothetical protein